jgi:hypothetical protein
MKSISFTAKHFSQCLAAALAFATLSNALMGADEEEKLTKEVRDPSPDGKYAFIYTKAGLSKSYDLIEKKSGKVLTHVADAELADIPQRFDLVGLLWRPDSKAFALTVQVEKRANTVVAFVWNGNAFDNVEIPELLADIPVEYFSNGKRYPHVNTNNSLDAVSWKKNGTLIVEVMNVLDGADGTVEAIRTVELNLRAAGKAEIAKSSVKYTVSK